MQNIVGTFDDANSARLALERLARAGIPRDRLFYQPSTDAEFIAHAGHARPRPGQPGYRPQGVLESFGGFWASLLESHTDESGIYSEALRRGTCLVMVQAEDATQARQMVRLLQDSGAIGLEERVAQWRVEGWPSRAQGEGAPAGGEAVGSALPPAVQHTGGAVGTHSFTGGGAAVGMPAPSGSQEAGERAMADAGGRKGEPGDGPPTRAGPQR